MSSIRQKDISNLLLTLIIIVLVNFISGYLFTRFDLTEEKRFTLSDQTVDLLDSLQEELNVKVYLDGNLDPGFLRLRNETKEMLTEFEAFSNGNLIFEFINPYDLGGKPEQIFTNLAKEGLQPTNVEIPEEGGLKQKYIVPGALMYYQNRKLPIQLLKSELNVNSEYVLNKSIEALEFELTNTIRKLIKNKREKIGFLSGHGEIPDNEMWDAASSLNEYYQALTLSGDSITQQQIQVVDRVKLTNKEGQVLVDALKDYKGLIVAKPIKQFTDPELVMLDQYIMNGGKVMWCLDVTSIDMDSLTTGLYTMSFPLKTGLEPMLYNYGVRLNQNLIQDLQCGQIPVFVGYEGNQPKYKRSPWYYNPLVTTNNEHLIVTNLDPIRTSFVSSMDTIPVPDVKKTVLLTSSKNSKLLRVPVRVSLQTAVRTPDTRKYNKGKQNIAILLEGEFDSFFKNRLVSKGNRDVKKKSVPTKMIVVADGDIIKNEVNSAGSPFPLSYDKFYSNMIAYDNKKFILNAMNYLMGDEDLIPIRSRRIAIRLLDSAKIKQDKQTIVLINTALPMSLVLIVGLIAIYRRKLKYSR